MLYHEGGGPVDVGLGGRVAPTNTHRLFGLILVEQPAIDQRMDYRIWHFGLGKGQLFPLAPAATSLADSFRAGG